MKERDMDIIKKCINFAISKTLEAYYYSRYILTGNDYRAQVQIMSIDDTITYMSKPNSSIIRYGDGEFMLMEGKGIGNYQGPNQEMAERLTQILTSPETPELLICLPEPISGVDDYVTRSQKYWIRHNKMSMSMYLEKIDVNRIYGNSFVSRPYMIYRKKDNCAHWFERLKSLFSERDLLIIEGWYSRTGVGNDLFVNANSISRIICPPTNAYRAYEKILAAAKQHAKDKLVIVALGPTGKLLSFDLIESGFWVLDLGHIDSEYEWFKRGSTRKERVGNKHSAECRNEQIEECLDEDYNMSIVARIE